jgi:biopolymer transport protein ExbB
MLVALAMAAAGAGTSATSAQSEAQARGEGVAGSAPAGAVSQKGMAAPSAPSPEASSALPAEVSSSMPSVAGASVPAKTIPHDLSPWGMFLQADIIVKAVMTGLAFASLMTWTVWLAKAIELGRAKRRLRRGIAQILATATLGEAVASFENGNDTGAVLVREAADELRVSAQVLDHTESNGVNERVTSRLSRVETEAGQRMTKGTGVLATIGATAPFIGLFGTVWGIMNAFIGISQTQTTNLAVVAPGIAEALLATALGLVAAIPAVIIYNAFVRSITSYRRLLGDASAGIERLVSRELDFRRIPASLARSGVRLWQEV